MAASTLQRARRRIFAPRDIDRRAGPCTDHRHGLGSSLVSPPAQSGTESRGLGIVRSILGLECLPVFLAFLLGSWALRSRSVALLGSVALALATATAFAAPGALENPLAEGTAAQIEEFADWRDAIPRGDNVFIVPRYYTAGFAWFTLQRPSYLTVDQSSGVIFSRATAVEVRRRSEVLRPIKSPTGVYFPAGNSRW